LFNVNRTVYDDYPHDDYLSPAPEDR